MFCEKCGTVLDKHGRCINCSGLNKSRILETHLPKKRKRKATLTATR